MPIFNGGAARRSFRFSLLLPDPSPRPLHRIAHHRAPLLPRDPVKMLAERPVSSVRSGAAIRDRAAECDSVVAVEIGPGRADQLGVMRVARTGLRDVKDRRVEPTGTRATYSARIGRIASLDGVDADERICARRERP